MRTLELTWLDSRETVSLAELSRACGMNADELAELVDYGALAPVESTAQGSFFSADCIVQLRTVGKLRVDFDLDVFTVAVLMGYLDRIDELERQVRSLQAKGSDRGSQTQHSEGNTS
jgi:chaperone modulatory protein CbpM